MEPQVLYQASFTFDPFWLVGPVMFACFLGCLIRGIKKARKSGKIEDRFGIVIGLTGCLSILIFVMILVPDKIKAYNATVDAYKRGEYEIVEGYVKDFHPMPYWGHDQESFTIDGVSFAYSDYSGSFGYHNAKSHGGVIIGDGQHLRIGYTVYSKLGNVIVYIEALQ